MLSFLTRTTIKDIDKIPDLLQIILIIFSVYTSLFFSFQVSQIAVDETECVSTGAAGARTRRSLGHHLLHPLILRLFLLCTPADFEAQSSLLQNRLHPQIQIPNPCPVSIYLTLAHLTIWEWCTALVPLLLETPDITILKTKAYYFCYIRYCTLTPKPILF